MDRALDDQISDDELTALALAAEPVDHVDPDAVPLRGPVDATSGLLPDWYMPMPSGLGRSRTRRAVLGALVLALVVVNGAGLCVTNGLPEIAW